MLYSGKFLWGSNFCSFHRPSSGFKTKNSEKVLIMFVIMHMQIIIVREPTYSCQLAS